MSRPMVYVPGMGWGFGPLTDEELGWEPEEDEEYLDYLASGGDEPGVKDWTPEEVPSP